MKHLKELELPLEKRNIEKVADVKTVTLSKAF